MKKTILSSILISSIALSPTLRAEDVSSEGTPVGQAASEGSNAAKRKRWQNIAIAAGAIAIAVTALILIASNDGHHD